MLWQHWIHQISMMIHRVLHADTSTLLGTSAMLLTALAFLVVGLLRWVEFTGFGFSRLRLSILVTMHIVGCITLAFAFAIEAIDLDKKLSALGMGLLCSALLLLFPIHIYIGLLRRLRNPALKGFKKP